MDLEFGSQIADLSPALVDEIDALLGKMCLNSRDNEEAIVFELERLFPLMCEQFLLRREQHGFSQSTYQPISSLKARVLQHSGFGAVAKVVDGHDVIEVKQGTVVFLLWASLKFVAANEDGAETITLRRRRAPNRETWTLFDSYDVPKDPDLLSLAMTIALFAFHFVVFHELGHLSQGHCRFLKEQQFLDFSPELRTKCDSPTHQALEFFADGFAVRELNVLMRDRRQHWLRSGETGSLFLDRQRQCYSRVELSDLCFYAALAITFYLTHSGGARHPAREIRFLSCILMSKVYRSIREAESGAEWMSRVASTTNAVGAAIEMSRSPGEPFEPIIGVLSRQGGESEVMAQIKRYVDDFSSVRPRLQRFALAPKAFLDLAYENGLDRSRA